MPAPFAPSATMAPGPVGALRLLAAFRREDAGAAGKTGNAARAIMLLDGRSLLIFRQ